LAVNPSTPLLAGKVALVTGAAQGIGFAVARAYLDHGAAVALADVNAEKTRAAANALEERAPGRVLPLALDVTDEAANQAAIGAVAERFGRLDCAVANAGTLALAEAVDMPLERFRAVLEVNLTGAFLTARSAARRMLAQGGGGRIIVTSSLFGVRGGRENAAYSASKFGVIGVVESMAAELAPHGVLVNAVCPGQIQTEMIETLVRERLAAGQEDPRARLVRRIPAGRLGDPAELAGTFVFLASDLSAYLTGQAIVVDGGWQVG